ncbi:HK97 family phage prohead protease [Paracoccus sp. SSK6]|uniref:HK97 family phage prohead protease n=1 Tax=Paracoccus sp. SSK6 TaxID=3143131 RepID=UPI00321A5C44
MEKKFFQLELKAVGDGNTIEGYGSVFGNEDKIGDVVLPGAFRESIATKMPKMLWQHSPDKVIGKWDEVVEDASGLRVKGSFANTPKAQEVAELVRIGAIDGLSIGYRTIESDYNADGVRLLRKLDLWEISVVTFPCNEAATIDAVKAAELSKKEVEQILRDAGFSKSVAMKLISGGYDALSGQRDADADKQAKNEDYSELAALLIARANLLK